MRSLGICRSASDVWDLLCQSFAAERSFSECVAGDDLFVAFCLGRRPLILFALVLVSFVGRLSVGAIHLYM